MTPANRSARLRGQDHVGNPLTDSFELDLHDLIADPMVRLVMEADGIDERELRELLDRVTSERRFASTSPSDSSDLAQPETGQFRRSVGIMLINKAGSVLAGRRKDMRQNGWQMPQGGIEPGETPWAAAIRELREEIGTANVEGIAEIPAWLAYEVPQDILHRIPGPAWKGQAQRWFLMRFRGQDSEIDVATEHPEFSSWKWLPPERLVDLIVPFKREVYRRVIDEFAPHIARALAGNS